MFKFQYHLIINLILFLQFSPPVSAIRKDVSFREKHTCRTTVQGRFFLADDNGRVCDAFAVDPLSRCCPGKGDKFSCHGCNLVSQCCNSYEFCVSCCLKPATTHKELALKIKIAKPVTAGIYQSVFDFCAGRCRHNSESVVHENAYISDFHHCFSLSSNSSGSSSTQVEARLAGINVFIGRQGESCDLACKSNGQSCVPNKLAVLNECEVIQKYMSCKGACLSSIGADQPAEVVEDAPKHLVNTTIVSKLYRFLPVESVTTRSLHENPGACLYTKTESMLSCDGSHRHTRRLCPCA
ncbi:hypothetical protein BUALT_Bualt14G0022900 [Buddleja alternifolia]|uniref:SREBP regulating gene protein n=1 Tax=Buddleja alternifolia TaxID=168488 RepID=A0AAV6WH59_9LAMI|nr:hypothetical protein BUALT_Bualt14G0022900 [Buddleja alternifolia]